MHKRDHSLTKHIQSFVYHLTVKKCSPRTIEQYTSQLRRFLLAHDKVPIRISSDEIVSYIASLKSGAHMRQCRGTLMNFYTHVIGQPDKFARIPYPKKEKFLPTVLASEDVVARLHAIANLKHRTILSLIYSCGLRRQELLNLLIKDVDGKRLTLHIRQSKGAKDRMSPLSPSMLALLRQYFMEYRPVEFLFNGADGGAYSASSLRNICQRHMGCNPHALRHSYATHLSENGIPLGILADRMGHHSVKTTMIYHHVMREKNPLHLGI